MNLRLIQGQLIFPSRINQRTMIHEALGHSLRGEPLVVYPAGNLWQCVSIRSDQVPLIPSDAIAETYETIKDGGTLFPEKGRLFVLNVHVEPYLPPLPPVDETPRE